MKILLGMIAFLALAATAASILVGVDSYDGTVSSTPYADGIRWDRTLRRAAALGWRLQVDARDLRTGTHRLRLSIVDRAGGDRSTALRDLRLSRPFTNRFDRELPFSLEGGETAPIRVGVTFPRPGRWTIEADVAAPGGSLTLSREITVGER